MSPTDRLESQFQAQLIVELKERYPGCLVLKNDANYIQGIPDLLLLWWDRWAALEVKADSRSASQPNQVWYIEKMNVMSFASFIHRENKEEVLDALDAAFGVGR